MSGHRPVRESALNGSRAGPVSLMFSGNPVVTGVALVAVGLVVLAALVTVLLPAWLLLRRAARGAFRVLRGRMRRFRRRPAHRHDSAGDNRTSPPDLPGDTTVDE